MRDWLVRLPRRQKRLLQIVTDVLLLWLALWLGFVLRLGLDQHLDPFGKHLWLFVAAPLIAIPIFIRFGLYRAVMRYIGNDALMAIFKAVTLSALLLTLVMYWNQFTDALIPRSAVFNYWWLSLMLIGGLRLLMRQYFLGDWYGAIRHVPFMGKRGSMPRVAIWGAGQTGNQLVHALRLGRGLEPVAFIDDDRALANRVIAGLKVYSRKHVQQMLDETGVQEILLAIPSASRACRGDVLAYLEKFPVHVRSVPSFMDLASGRVKVEDIQEVDIADLLGREAVPPRQELFERCIRDKVVMVTGAGGSIGSELCRQIISSSPKTLLLFEHSEFNLYSIHGELERIILKESAPIALVPLLGSVRDYQYLEELMREWGVETVYHAAAYKHVPMVEHNITEGVLNNVFGSLYTAQAALVANVENFVLISTDKAVRPTNVMGSTKRIAEMILQAVSQEIALLPLHASESLLCLNKTRFTMVRFGNVLGSSGSVIPRFREQISRGGPVTVTHPNITRYFMTIPEAAQLVIQAGSMGRGGDVFVLDMGGPVRIVDLAEKLIKLSGSSVRSENNPNGEIAIEFSGLRPGEKLYEELLIADEGVTSTEHPMIMRADEEYLSWAQLRPLLEHLLKATESKDHDAVRRLLREMVSGYVPEGEIVDWCYLLKKNRGPINAEK
ncbi:polysaccharide biosynthesis protein [Pseudomonas sp. JBR1]|uniref:polysaccharide biosynthesis protein n=1 Tax=Pseudomonas sp. JBR1 TaxID=3020907 RepID=UPI00230550E3|nr:nucleoside-diphosphate sugar epimerase/dehydratase [Pseudomonas sp. JBR1]WCE07574.1 nucleoside-diphosphate sugar epimerase/dehydratase [Pseudomonas sp. JBR1]